MNKLFARIQREWDWWVYNRSSKSIERLCEHSPTIAYFFKFYFDQFTEEHPISESLRSSAEEFYRAMNEHEKNEYKKKKI